MKPAAKAALLSGLAFPGLGQIYLRRYLRGGIIAALALLALGVTATLTVLAFLEVLNTTQIDLSALESGTMSLHLNESSGHYFTHLVVTSLLSICCWAFSIVDAYSIGRKYGRDPKHQI
jgi:hypothetical protein